MNIELTDNQQAVFDNFKKFIEDETTKVFILNGYAGTGKTTLVRFFIQELKDKEIKFVLMASTGRAAKILSNITGNSARTVHSIIYALNGFNKDMEKVVIEIDKTGVDKTGQLLLNFQLKTIEFTGCQCFYLVDEASMISDVEDKTPTQAKFGQGKLLSDLLKYDPNGKFVFVGDECQLPPVRQDISPALSPNYFKETFKVNAVENRLTQIVRQQADNTIILASEKLRHLYANPPQVKWGKLPLGNYQHIRLHPDTLSMINRYLSIIKGGHYEKSTFISPTNRKCYSSNQFVREALGFSGNLQVGELLLVTQNNILSGLLNGDLVVVEQISNVRYQKGTLSFLQIEVRELATGRRVTQLIIENILYSQVTNLSEDQQKLLFIDFYRRMKKKGIRQKDLEFHERLSKDIFLNSLRCVFGYTLTCHKAQGGEWDEVFVDMSRNITLNAKSSAYQWVYTAVTRAKEQLNVVDDFYISK